MSVQARQNAYFLIIVQVVDLGIVQHQLANLHVALVRDCMIANYIKTLGSFCLRPPWLVAKDDLRLWFDLSSRPAVRPTHWQFIRGNDKGQLSIGDLSQRVNLEHGIPVDEEILKLIREM